MKKHLVLFSLFIIIGQGSIHSQTIGDPFYNAVFESNMRLHFVDNFSFLDQSKWHIWNEFDHWGASTNMVYLSECVSVNPYGHLQLDIKNEAFIPTIIATNTNDPACHHSSYNYKGGYVELKPPFEKASLGFIEARISFPHGPGHHNAFWTVSPQGVIPLKPTEIDIVEAYGNDNSNIIKTNKHYCYQDKDPSCWHSGTLFQQQHQLSMPYANTFHTYGLKTTNTDIIWEFNGNVIRTQPYSLYPPDHMKVLINTGLENSYTGSFTQPYHMYVDWVRIYTYCSDIGKTPYILNPTDDLINPGFKQVTLAWQLPCADIDYNQCTVEYGTTPTYGSQPIIILDDKTYHFYSTMINGLLPSTKYYYRIIVDGTQQLFSGSFNTPPASNAQNTVFYITGSTGTTQATQGNSTHNTLCSTLTNHINNDPNGQTLLIHTGKMVEADNEANWSSQWFNPDDDNAVNLRANMPMISAIGANMRKIYDTPNNILFDNFPGSNYRRYFPYIYDSPYAFYDPTTYPLVNYRYDLFFDYGPVGFCLPEITKQLPDVNQVLTKIETNLVSSTKDWKVLCFSYPMKSLFGDQLDASFAHQLRQLAMQYGVQLVIMGHENYYAHWIEDGVHYMILGNGGDMSEGIDDLLLSSSNVLCASTTPHFARFRIEDDLMFVDVIQGADWNGTQAGHIIERFAIPKTTHIQTNTIWQQNVSYPLIVSNIEIDQNVSLEVKSEIQVAQDGIIAVSKGARLSLNTPESKVSGVAGFAAELDLVTRDAQGNIINSYKHNYSKQPDLWFGIFLRGDNDQNQEENCKGVVEFNNGAQLENAVLAVDTCNPDMHSGFIPGTGGIIRAENSTFRNCETAVKMYPFKNSGPLHHSFEKSYFKGCTFVTDDDYLLKGITAPTHMDIDGIYQLKLQGCSFLNDQTIGPGMPKHYPQQGTGIMAHNSSLIITPLCTTQTVPCSGQIRNSFTKLYKAANLSQPPTQQSYSSLINEADFNDNFYAVYANSLQNLAIQQCSLVENYRGIYLLNSQSATVTNNHIEIAPVTSMLHFQSPYGLYLNAGDGFTIEGNDFVNNHSTNTSYGIVVNNTGAKNNEIYRNTFQGLISGIQPQHRNKGFVAGEYVGLCLFCNEFDNLNGKDIMVLGKSLSDCIGYIGIHPTQQISLGSTYLPAGNLFSPGHLNLSPGFDDNDFSNYDADHLIYAYDPNSTNGRLEPYVYSNITPVIRYSSPTQCMPKTGNINSLSQGYTKLASAQVAWNSSKLILNIWKNGGIEDLEQQVELVLPWEAYQQYNELMSISPYVAADALIAMIQNPSFTDLMVKLVCVANPQASRNDAVLGALYDRNPPMPEQYIEEILDESGSYSPLDELEGNAAADYHLVRTVGNEILRLYYADTLNLWATDSITQFLSRLPGLEDRYAYALHCLRTGDFSTMHTVLDEIPSQFELSERENIEYGFMTDAFSLLEVIRENDLQPGDLTVEQTEPLMLMLETEGTVDNALAISILLWNDPFFEYYEPILEPSGYQMRKAPKQQKLPAENLKFNIYPNPARDYFTASWDIPSQQQFSASIIVTDAVGRELMMKPLPSAAGEMMVDISTLPKGVFNVWLVSNKKPVVNRKLVVLN